MSKYIVKARSFINGRIYEAGEEIDFEGNAGHNLVAKDKASNEDRPQPVDPDADKILDDLRNEYIDLFGEAPHHNAGAKSLQEKIDAKKKELGV
ncbi:hypothetical protein P262_02770 [Cronobacter malonaticus]|uniref:Uncharacterized protein n=1 Tax=Cronobacter malonaticus TaxID=413503 RepID=V5TYH6_9ENTR|nr:MULTISPECIES: hypothetical protein [Cronobacter]AHB70336.1 hypothetical protein P262_02770 [Cronobacter malonaticus]MCI0215004.1 hypothetical protein [Cronobacter sakazakii]TWR40492.1 hypothetical protein FQY86_06395 [Cronobacter sakazakii]USI30431.1 hypothetical protein NES82_10725 [Cronobacter sakazakii]